MTKVDESIIEMVGDADRNEFITHRLIRHLRKTPDRVAYIQGDRIVTWRESIDRTYRICQSLISTGVRKGDRVAVLGKNSIEYAEVMTAVILIGACAVPLPFMENAKTIILMLKNSNAKVLFSSKALAGMISSSLGHGIELLDGATILLDGELPSWQNLYKWISCSGGDGARPNTILKEEDEFNINYSSGTTGASKGILYKHKARNIIARSFFVDMSVRTLLSTPLYSNMTFATWYPTIFNGGTTIIVDKFDEEETLKLIEKYKVNVAMFVPTQYERMLSVADFDNYDLSSMERKYSTSSPLSESTKKLLLERFPGLLIEFYSTTEGGAGTILIADLFPTKLSSVGKVGPGQELKVIDENDKEVTIGQCGEIIGRSPIMSAGYVNNQVLDARLRWYDAAGRLFFRTGDIGRLDNEGFLYLLGRKNDLIISGGINLYATDLENIFMQHHDVKDVAVVAAPSKVWGETPVAFVVKEPLSTINDEELREWVNRRLGKSQKVTQVKFIDLLPRSVVGKILKHKLREQILIDSSLNS